MTNYIRLLVLVLSLIGDIKLLNRKKENTGLVDVAEHTGLPYAWLWYRLSTNQIALPLTPDEVKILKKDYEHKKKPNGSKKAGGK